MTGLTRVMLMMLIVSGLLSGAIALVLLWLLVTQPLHLAQLLARLQIS